MKMKKQLMQVYIFQQEIPWREEEKLYVGKTRQARVDSVIEITR